MKTLYEFCMENNRTELLDQWDREANKDMTPETVARGSGKKAWWRCEKGHRWQAVINSRSGGSGCPVCSGRVVVYGSNDLETELPELASEWHPTKNMPLTPAMVTRGCHRSVWWKCEKGHEWKAVIKARAAGCACPVCAGRKVQTGVNDLRTLDPELASEWHPVKNGVLTPDTVLATSLKRVWWRCRYGHEWQAKIKDRMNGTGCPVCGGQKVVEGVNDLASQYPLLMREWHPTKNGSVLPQKMTAYNNKRVWWQCALGHEWRASVYSRTQGLTGCPYCANRKVLPGFNDLATLQPRVAAGWHPTMNGPLTPDQVTVGSKKKVWWICPEGHIWKAVIYSRTGSRKTGCPICAGNISKKQLQRYKTLK